MNRGKKRYPTRRGELNETNLGVKKGRGAQATNGQRSIYAGKNGVGLGERREDSDTVKKGNGGGKQNRLARKGKTYPS